MPAVVVFLIFVICLILAIPVSISLGIASVLPGAVDPSFTASGTYVIRSMLGGIDSFPLLAVPMFVLSGIIMARGGISRKLFDVFAYFMGKRTAGMPCAVVVTCLFYGAISGSAPATVAAVGSMTIPILMEMGYDKKFSTALVAVAGGLGVIIPPSIPFIMYGTASGASVSDLFIAGIIPGVMIGGLLMVYAIYYCKKHGEDQEKKLAMVGKLHDKGLLRVLKDSAFALLSPVIILGCIYTGVASPTEAAVISVFYALIISLFVYKSIKIRDIWTIMVEAIRTYAPILFILAASIAFSRVLTLMQVPQEISAWILAHFTNKIVLLLVLNVFLLIVGMVMDTTIADRYLCAGSKSCVIVEMLLQEMTWKETDTDMKYRRLTGVMVSVAFLGLLTGCAGKESTEQRYAYPLGTASPEDTVTQIYAEKFAEEADRLSDGRIKITVYPNSVLGGDRELLESCYDGDIPFVVQNTAPQVNFIDDTAIFDAPCVFDDIEELRDKVDQPEFLSRMQESYRDAGYELLGYADQGFRVMSSNKEVSSFSDFKGQKIRTMEDPYQLSFWKKLKANPTPMSFSEVYIGLQQHTIDAQENPYEVIVSNRLYEQQDYIIETNHVPHLISLIVSEDFYKKLSEEDQKILREAEEIAKEYAREKSDERISEKIREIEESGTKIITPDEETREQMKEASTPVYDQIEKVTDPELFHLYTGR